MATGLVLEWQEQLPLLGWSVVWSWGRSVLGTESQKASGSHPPPSAPCRQSRMELAGEGNVAKRDAGAADRNNQPRIFQSLLD